MLSLVGPIISLVSKFIDKAVPDKDMAEKLKSDFATQVHDLMKIELQGAIQIILAEASGAWLQRNWRPILMMVIVTIIANNYILVPYLQAIFGWGVQLDLPGDMWDLMKIGLGGYVIGRSAEKVTKTWKE